MPAPQKPASRQSLSGSLSGSLCALVTPFDGTSDQKFSDELFITLAKRQRDNGTSALVPCGTTGESPTLEDDEFDRMVQHCLAVARGTPLQVIPGTGGNNTREAVRLTERAAKLGADACLIVVPYYNKPSPDGIVRHFEELNAVGIPLILYNIPGRTGINVAPETIRTIADRCEYVVGVKAANGDLDEISETCALGTATRPLAVLSGDDSLTLPILAVGGTGVISVIANLLPRTNATLVSLYSSGDLGAARTLSRALHPLSRALLKAGPNPAPIKTLLQLGGYPVGDCRLPLVPLSGPTVTLLRSIAIHTRDELRTARFDYDEILDVISDAHP